LTTAPSPETHEAFAPYNKAYEALQKATKESVKTNFRDLADVPDNVNDSEFIIKLTKTLDSKNSNVKDRSLWNICKSAVKYLSHTLKPFTKHFLEIAKDASAVLPVSQDCS